MQSPWAVSSASGRCRPAALFLARLPIQRLDVAAGQVEALAQAADVAAGIRGARQAARAPLGGRLLNSGHLGRQGVRILVDRRRRATPVDEYADALSAQMAAIEEPASKGGTRRLAGAPDPSGDIRRLSTGLNLPRSNVEALYRQTRKE